MSKRLKDNYGKLIVGLIMIAVSTVSIMAQRQSDSTIARINNNDETDRRQDKDINRIMVVVTRLETRQEQTKKSQFILHQKMNELLTQNGVSKARIIEIEMRRDTTDTNVAADTAGIL